MERKYRASAGFTLIELMVVVTILSIFAIITIPRISNYFSSRSENVSVFTKIIAKTHDDSFLNNRINILTIHLYKADKLDQESKVDIYRRKNGVSVLNLEDNVFIDNPRKILQFHEFPDSFRIEQVVLRNGTVVKSGKVMIPFYPQGYSENASVHILVNSGEKWTIHIRRHYKEPEVVREWM